jgi:hypothetical protein
MGGDSEVDEVEQAFKIAWTGADSTPFLADAPISESLRTRATEIVRTTNLSSLFNVAPTLATWAILAPLADNYGMATKDVYLHISQFVGEDYSDSVSRERLKNRYRRAARALGLPVSGNLPTELFFAPLGPARSHHSDLALAFVGMALYRGPPAIEDTSAAREWQRRAVADRCATIPRLKATIHFDSSAHCARRFDAWRKGSLPIGPVEANLFQAYDNAATRFGRSRSDILGPPRLFWTGISLALKAENSKHSQSVQLGPFPTHIAGGTHLSIKAPWPENLTWQANGLTRDLAVAPAAEEVLVFDEVDGELISRVRSTDTTVVTPSRRLVVMSRLRFISPSFGASGPAADPSYQIAWIEAGETLSFDGREDVTLTLPTEPSIWTEGYVLGRDGPLPLLACDGHVFLKLDPEIGGHCRILRAHVGTETRFSPVSVDDFGHARISFASLGLNRHEDPCHVLFEILAPGAAGDPQARSELSNSAWIWPGVEAPIQDLENVPRPSNLVSARSAGLVELDGRISVNPRSDVEIPILGLQDGERLREVRLRARTEKLWHFRVATSDRVFVPKCKLLFFGYGSRHDSLRLRSADHQANLLVLGKTIKRPFFSREVFEINAEMLEDNQVDDRIALIRSDGVIDVLARVRRTNDQVGVIFSETDEGFRISITTKHNCDAVRIRFESALGTDEFGDFPLGRRPVDHARLSAADVELDSSANRIDITVRTQKLQRPARVSFEIRKEGSREFVPVVDNHNVPISIGLSGLLAKPDSKGLERLASFLAMPSSEWLDQQLPNALTPAYEDAIRALAKSRMVTQLRCILNVRCPDGCAPQHDIVGVAPWIFEASGHAFGGLKSDGGFASLSLLGTQNPPSELPDPNGDTPLSGWLSIISASMNLPSGFRPEDLQNAFRLLRFRLDNDSSVLKLDGPIGSACRLVCDTHVEGLDSLRSFDHAGGGDPFPSEIVATVERFARACAAGQSEHFVEKICFRTGLSRQSVGQVLTLMVRAAVEAFVHFRSLWSHTAEITPRDEAIPK